MKTVESATSNMNIEPMDIDTSITFDSIGGLGKHIRALKEMFLFPIWYPEIFDKFNITPPRGVLFHGPQGTGKTLVARALANECSNGHLKIAFFMRKGADCLSKWVGESERQLRLLFEQAYKMRPSIIFFDEIDAIAPVRSSRQDQVHNTVVCTLLALMDGLDSRGQVVVIGATNRIDSIDPALRRPGRFDREFHFPLPTLDARKQILHIHTNKWNPKLSDTFIDKLAKRCVGYCGADMKALCTECVLQAIRRQYPEIYTSMGKLQLNAAAISIAAKDFYRAMQSIVPANHRTVGSPGEALNPTVLPLMLRQFQKALMHIQDVFPSALSKKKTVDAPATSAQTRSGCEEITLKDYSSDDDDNEPSIYEKAKSRRHSSLEKCGKHDSCISFDRRSGLYPTTYRPRLLMCGTKGQGQTSHLGPAVLHHFEQLHVNVLDLRTVFSASNQTPEDACGEVFRQARRNTPSIVYIPNISRLWEVLSDTLRATFLTVFEDVDPATPLLIVATSELPFANMHYMIQRLFEKNEILEVLAPETDERKDYFGELLLNQATKPPTLKTKADCNKSKLYKSVTSMWPLWKPEEVLRALRILDAIPQTPSLPLQKMSDSEIRRLHKQKEEAFKEIQHFLKDCFSKLERDKKFAIFLKIAANSRMAGQKPMDFTRIATKINLQKYHCAAQFADDINQICLNVLTLSRTNNAIDRVGRQRACELHICLQDIMKTDLDLELEKQCQKNVVSKYGLGLQIQDMPPTFYFAKPSQSQPQPQPQASSSNRPKVVRSSRRLQGIGEVVAPLELLEKQWRIEKRYSKSPQGKKRSHNMLAGAGSGVACSSIDDIDLSREKKHMSRSSHYDSRSDDGMMSRSRDSQKRPSLPEMPCLVVDLPRLQRLQDNVVIATDQCNFEKLQQLHTIFCQSIYKHKQHHDKTALVEELDAKFDEFNLPRTRPT